MPEEALQAAFGIKVACDEISRKLLRWHWEQTIGARSPDTLMQHLARRQEESPEYYERLPDLHGTMNWQKLDTSVCMRVLLDPEKDAEKPLGLLECAKRPAAARSACNAVRVARNEAAHATDRADAVQAAILFHEAIESLEAAYAETALRVGELEEYYRMAEKFLTRCGGQKPLTSAGAEEKEPAPRRTPKTEEKPRRSRTRTSEASAKQRGGKHTANTAGKMRKKQRQIRVNRAAATALLAIAVLGLLVRAYTMGLLG